MTHCDENMNEAKVFCMEIELEPDEFKGYLGCNIPVTEVSEQSDRILYEERRNCTVECRVVNLQWGSFRNAEAALIVFEFNFVGEGWKTNSRRIVRANIEVSFGQGSWDPTAASGDSDDTSRLPRVAQYCPALLEGPITVVTRETERTLEFPVSFNLPSNPLEMGMKYAINKRETLFDRHRLMLKGWAIGSSRRSQPHRVKWTVEEDRALKEGVPSIFRLATLVECQKGASIDSTLRLEAYSGRRRWIGTPWTAEKPLVLGPGVEVGKALQDLNFDGLTDEHWGDLIQFTSPLSKLQMTKDSQLVIFCESQSASETTVTHASVSLPSTNLGSSNKGRSERYTRT